MNNVLGSFWNPYSYFDYEEECRNHTWYGGWVFIGSNHDKIYITTNGSVEQKEGTDELGSEENPFSLTAYNEMFGNRTWIGGYVQEEDDCVYYPPQEDESGCGCGCGEGCGCGSGPINGNGNIIPGSDHVFMPNIEFDFSWSAGTATSGVEVQISNLWNDSSVVVVSVGWEWKGNYTIQFSVSYRYVNNNSGNTMTCNYYIPEANIY